MNFELFIITAKSLSENLSYHYFFLLNFKYTRRFIVFSYSTWCSDTQNIHKVPPALVDMLINVKYVPNYLIKICRYCLIYVKYNIVSDWKYNIELYLKQDKKLLL